ncbi:MAG: transporter [Acidobacteriia bacterium]|nr:transporter [Terriglobia bacterium]
MVRFYDLLATQPVVLLFTVVGLGYFLGNLKIGGFRLGIAAVLFVGLGFGAADPRFAIPEVIYVLGLIVFVYTVGLQSGPIFFNLFRRQWLKITSLALVSTVIAAALTVAAARALHVPAPVASGLFCGSLTNTPALAAAVEALRSSLAGAPLDETSRRLALDGPTVGYSIAYPLGVAGLIIVMQLSTRFARIDLKSERKRAVRSSGMGSEELLSREVRVTNPQIVGKTYGESLATEVTGMVFTRLKRGSSVDLVVPERVLNLGDVLVGVGSPEAVRKAELLIGPLVQEQVERLSPGIEYRDLLVLDRKVAGTAAARLSDAVGHPVIVSRIRRGGVQITPHPETVLEFGDQVRIVTDKDFLDRATEVVGNPMTDYSEADFLSFSFGMILGVLLGTVPIPLPGGQRVTLGFAGGPLVVALILGRLGRTGPIVWTMPPNANLTMRQLGILFFLAGVGTRAGGSFVHTFQSQGLVLLLVGASVTLVSSLLIVFLAYRVFGYDMISTFGMLSGIHTQPAALAFANAHTGSDHPNVSYAAVYPVALIAKIVLAQVLVLMAF